MIKIMSFRAYLDLQSDFPYIILCEEALNNLCGILYVGKVEMK